MSSFYSVWRRPKSYEDFVDCSVIAVTGFASALVFYSPQFVLWIVAVVVFSPRKFLQYLSLLLAISTYSYFPYAADFTTAYPSQLSRGLFLVFLRTCSVSRLAIIGLCAVPAKLSRA